MATLEEKESRSISLGSIALANSLSTLATMIVDRIPEEVLVSEHWVPKEQEITDLESVKSTEEWYKTPFGREVASERIVTDILYYAKIEPMCVVCGILAKEVQKEDFSLSGPSVFNFAHNMLQYPFTRLQEECIKILLNQ